MNLSNLASPKIQKPPLFKRIVILILFTASYLISIYSISNKLGTHIHAGMTPTGKYIPHDYYTGFPTQTPFKVVSCLITLVLLWFLVRNWVGHKNTILWTISLSGALVILGGYLAVALFLEF